MSEQSSAKQFYKDNVAVVGLVAPAIFISDLDIQVLKDLSANPFIIKFLKSMNFLEIRSADEWYLREYAPKEGSMN